MFVCTGAMWAIGVPTGTLHVETTLIVQSQREMVIGIWEFSGIPIHHASTVARRTFELQISGGNEMVYHWLDQKPETIIPRCCPVELTEHVEKCKNICTSHLGHSVWSADTPPVCVYMERAPMFQEKGKGSHWSMFSEIRNNKQLSFENLGSCGHISEGS